VLFDKIAADNFSLKIIPYFALLMASSVIQHCANFVSTTQFHTL